MKNNYNILLYSTSCGLSTITYYFYKLVVIIKAYRTITTENTNSHIIVSNHCYLRYACLGSSGGLATKVEFTLA
jgi:hypothetical protein